MRARSSRSLSCTASASAEFRTPSTTSSTSSSRGSVSSTSTMPTMPLIGVRTSWLRVDRESDFSRDAASAASRAVASAREVSMRAVTSWQTMTSSSPATAGTTPSEAACGSASGPTDIACRSTSTTRPSVTTTSLACTGSRWVARAWMRLRMVSTSPSSGARDHSTGPTGAPRSELAILPEPEHPAELDVDHRDLLGRGHHHHAHRQARHHGFESLAVQGHHRLGGALGGDVGERGDDAGGQPVGPAAQRPAADLEPGQAAVGTVHAHHLPRDLGGRWRG